MKPLYLFTILIVAALGIAVILFSGDSEIVDPAISEKIIEFQGSFPSEVELIDNSNLMRVRADAEEDIVIVWNQGNQALYQFDKLGNYIRTVTNRGSGPGEIRNVSGITMSNGFIVLNDQSRFMFHLFDYEGGFVHSLQYSETILMDIALSHPFIIGQNALSISGDVSNEHSIAYIYNVESGDLIGDVKLNLTDFNPANRMLNLISVDDYFLLTPKAGNKVFKVEASSGELISEYEINGYDFHQLRERLSDLYEIDSPNIIIDMVKDESGYMLALNGPVREILRVDSEFNVVEILRVGESISFYENEYISSISSGHNQLYVLNGQGDGVVHRFSYD